ncbi:gamma-glutamylcyclotransferase family protein [Endozoicomonas arenosclerae]|uniref:gamma-glutamylcyclotransferase family protein n=1 Tax=Endozoicomonas arenosclerae TaxID=1633495 RepID=UPI000782E99F|nr:gamma-glutamylcyclotransferase family protein [Endozoicomonas arenosclerae]
MNYFAYGSNMSLARLKNRVPSAQRQGAYFLEAHDLRFHKASKDGSGKCDAFFTGDHSRVYGCLFDIDPEEKHLLDHYEGLGVGYTEKQVQLINSEQTTVSAFTYIALEIDPSLLPYDWYLQHVLIGAAESQLPESYIKQLQKIKTVPDPVIERAQKERAIHRQVF